VRYKIMNMEEEFEKENPNTVAYSKWSNHYTHEYVEWLEQKAEQNVCERPKNNL